MYVYGRRRAASQASRIPYTQRCDGKYWVGWAKLDICGIILLGIHLFIEQKHLRSQICLFKPSTGLEANALFIPNFCFFLSRDWPARPGIDYSYSLHICVFSDGMTDK